MIEFTEILENIDKMPFDSQEIIVDIINKRFAERKRELFIKKTNQSKKEYFSGNYSTGNSQDLFKTLKI